MGERHVPDKPTLDGLEQRWGDRWEQEGTYRFDRSKVRTDVYAIAMRDHITDRNSGNSVGVGMRHRF